jgi:hypothetical protein
MVIFWLVVSVVLLLTMGVCFTVLVASLVDGGVSSSRAVKIGALGMGAGFAAAVVLDLLGVAL